jgi:hypothetical protein
VDYLLLRAQAAAKAIRDLERDLARKRAYLDVVLAEAVQGGASATRTALVAGLSRETVHKAIRRARNCQSP